MTVARACIVAALVVGVLQALVHAATPALGSRIDALNSGASVTLALTGVTTGSGVLVGYLQTGAGDPDQTATVAATVGTATFDLWSSGFIRATNAGSGEQACAFFIAHNVQPSAGALTAVITLVDGTAAVRGMAIEVLDMAPTSATDVEDGIGETTATLTSHPSASPGLNTLTDVFLFGIGAASGTNTTYAAATDFTSLTADFDSSAATAQYLSTAAARSGETATWSNGVARRAANCLIAVRSTTSGSGAPSGPSVGSQAQTGHGL